MSFLLTAPTAALPTVELCWDQWRHEWVAYQTHPRRVRLGSYPSKDSARMAASDHLLELGGGIVRDCGYCGEEIRAARVGALTVA